MKKISTKSITDLEFPTVLEQAALRCATQLGKEAMLQTQPVTAIESVRTSVLEVHEYKYSHETEHRIPNHGFDSIEKELGLLGIENSKVEIEGFQRMAHLSKTTITLLLFFKKTKAYFPTLFAYGSGLSIEKSISKSIDAVIDRFGVVRDQASPRLGTIRRQMQQVRGKIGQSFGAAMGQYQSSGFLDDIRETVIVDIQPKSGNPQKGVNWAIFTKASQCFYPNNWKHYQINDG